MRKGIALLLLLVFLMGTTACVPAEDEFAPVKEGYVAADYGLLNSPAKENGQEGLLIAFEAEVTGTEGFDEGHYYLVASSSDGDWLVWLGGDMDGTFTDVRKIQAVEFLGKKVEVYATYGGFSGKYNLPWCGISTLETDEIIVLPEGTAYSIIDFMYDDALDGALKEDDAASDSAESAEAVVSNDRIKDGVFAFAADDCVDILSALDYTERARGSLAGDNQGIWAVYSFDMQVMVLEKTVGTVSAISLVQHMTSLRGTAPDQYKQSAEDMARSIISVCGVEDEADLADIAVSIQDVFETGEQTEVSLGGVTVGISYKNNIFTATFVPESSGLSPRNVPTRIDLEPDFLTDSDRIQEMLRLEKLCDYNAIVALADSYIEENTPLDDSGVHLVREIAQECLDLLAGCVVVKDDFDGAIEIFYNGVTQITSGINCVPSLSGDNSEEMIIGFRASGWVFFDEVQVKYGEDEIDKTRKNYQNIICDVEYGGILEQTNHSFSEKVREGVVS